MRRIYAVDEQGRSTPLKPVLCQDEARELQDILERNHDLLAGEQIRPDDPRRWLLIRREMAVPDPGTTGSRWSVDFVFADQDGIPTFVECKRFSDTRSRREVIGQMMEYAANGSYYWDKGTLLGYARSAAEKAGRSIEDALRDLTQGPQVSVENFFEQVENNLREGQIRLVFFMEEAPRELKSIVEFMNEQLRSVEILIVEARQYQQDRTRVVAPMVFGYTEEARQEKRIVSLAPVRGKVAWDRDTILDHLEQAGKTRERSALLHLFSVAERHPELIKLDFGSGQNGSAIYRNDKGAALLYVFARGEVQNATGAHFPSDAGEVQKIVSHADALSWNAPAGPGRYPTLTRPLGDLSDPEVEELGKLLVDLANFAAGKKKQN